MNIIDAIKSGKPFKREADRPNEWIIAGNNGDFQYAAGVLRGMNFRLGVNDILADDWEVYGGRFVKE